MMSASGLFLFLHTTLVYPQDPHSILAISSATIPESTKLSATEETSLMTDFPALGFIYVSEVSVEKGKMTVLSPCPGKLPKPFLILGAQKWIET